METARKMLVDINSCFATIEQQANPLLRGKEVVVAAYENERACILAASKEAKKLGIKTGWRIDEAQSICPNLIILTPDTQKYRFINKKLKKILKGFCPRVQTKSIDEFFLDFEGIDENLNKIALKIKERIKSELGEWISVSIGIGPNLFLAKIASNLEKPDGLVEINKNNFLKIYQKLKLTDLHGINNKNAYKLELNGIKNPLDFYHKSRQELRSIFQSIGGDYWYFRLRGVEMDDKERKNKKSFSAIFSLKNPAINKTDLSAVLFQLCLKVGKRCYKQKMGARAVAWWAEGESFKLSGKLHKKEEMINGWEIFREIYPKIPEFKNKVRKVVVVIYDLQKKVWQKNILTEKEKFRETSEVAEKINNKYGEGTIFPGTILGNKKVPDFIGFGNIE